MGRVFLVPLLSSTSPFYSLSKPSTISSMEGVWVDLVSVSPTKPIPYSQWNCSRIPFLLGERRLDHSSDMGRIPFKTISRRVLFYFLVGQIENKHYSILLILVFNANDFLFLYNVASLIYSNCIYFKIQMVFLYQDITRTLVIEIQVRVEYLLYRITNFQAINFCLR